MAYKRIEDLDDTDLDKERVQPTTLSLPSACAAEIRLYKRKNGEIEETVREFRRVQIISSTYDPTADVQLNSDVEDDWDAALEATQGRQR